MAYDLKALVDELKDKGLDVAEEAAKQVYEAVDAWLVKSAVESENKVDDILAAILPIVKPHVMEQLDKIDGEDDSEE